MAAPAPNFPVASRVGAGREKTPEPEASVLEQSLGLASWRTRIAPAPGLRRLSSRPSRPSVGSPAPTTRPCAHTARTWTCPQAPSRTGTRASADQQSPGTCPHTPPNAPRAPTCAPPPHSGPLAEARASRSDGASTALPGSCLLPSVLPSLGADARAGGRGDTSRADFLGSAAAPEGQ